MMNIKIVGRISTVFMVGVLVVISSIAFTTPVSAETAFVGRCTWGYTGHETTIKSYLQDLGIQTTAINNPSTATVMNNVGVSSVFYMLTHGTSTTFDTSDGSITWTDLPGGLDCDLVFLNCCDAGNSASSWKSKFNARTFIGWDWTVSSGNAASFGTKFFKYCKNGKTVGEAFNQAKSEVSTTFPPIISGDTNWYLDNAPPGEVTNLQTTSHSNAIGQWNDPQSQNYRIYFTWTDATDIGSGLEGYHILIDREEISIPGEWIDVNEGVESSYEDALCDDDDWYIHIRSKDKAGNWATETTHFGPFYIDATSPIAAFTHTVSELTVNL